MSKFAFIIHPISAEDIKKSIKPLSILPERILEAITKHIPPFKVSTIRGIRSLTGAETEGWFIAIPFTPRQFLSYPLDFVYKRLIQAGRLAEELGAKIVGLGAFTSVVGDGGITLAQNIDIGVTTGNSYTVVTAVEGAIEAAKLVGIEPKEAITAVVGATGSIGFTSARLLARQVPKMNLIGRNVEKLEKVKETIEKETDCQVEIHTDIREGLKEADIVLTVTSAMEEIIFPEDLKKGAVVCDVARPRDVSKRVEEERRDVLVIEGGVVEVPGNVDFGFDFGFPPRTAYACMAETMILALEDYDRSFTLGKEVTLEQADLIASLAKKHGFKLAGFRSFEKPVLPERIEEVRRLAGR
ncbi:shikimate dehydrogenase [bacterium]|nr:shikimate dehydrogenase [bacterium]